MKLLIDTHLLLLVASAPERLPMDASRMIADPAHELWFSAASIWEIALRCGRGVGPLDLDPGVFRTALLANGYSELAVAGHHCSAITALPHLPCFAQIILSQALADGMILLTSDPDLVDCAGPIRHLPLDHQTGDG